MWRDAPSEYGPHKTLYNRFVRWSVAGVFSRIFEALAAESRETGMVLDALPDADILIADRGYDSDRFREALNARGPAPCIPGRANRKTPVVDDKALYTRRNLVERMFGRLKDWRRIATRYDRCAHTFFSAICIAATFIFWL